MAAVIILGDMYLTQPILPLLSQEFHATAAEISTIITVSTLAVALTAPFTGAVADVLGRKRVIVTGGSSGIGNGIAQACAVVGIDVVVLEKHADFFRDFRGDTVHPSTLQVMDELGLIEGFLQLPHQRLQKMDGMFGGASVRIEQEPNPESRVTIGPERDALGMPRASVHWQLTDADWQANWEFNILATVRLVRAFLPALRRGRDARVVAEIRDLDLAKIAVLHRVEPGTEGGEVRDALCRWEGGDGDDPRRAVADGAQRGAEVAPRAQRHHEPDPDQDRCRRRGRPRTRGAPRRQGADRTAPP